MLCPMVCHVTVLSCHKSFQRSVKILVSSLSVKHSKVSFSFLLLVILTCFELQEYYCRLTLLFKKQSFSQDLSKKVVLTINFEVL